MGLFDLFRKRKWLEPEKDLPLVDEPNLFYHEDDFRQVELLTLENWERMKAESEKINAFSEEHFDGTAFTDTYGRNDASQIALNKREIIPAELESILASLGHNRVEKVYTGYGQSHRELHENCIGFGQNYCAVFYSHQDNIVQYIWFIQQLGMDREKLTHVLHEIGTKWNLLLQDWTSTITVDLRDRKFIEQYLGQYDETRAQIK